MKLSKEYFSEWEPIIRIGLRYLAAYLVTSGYVGKQAGQFLLEPAVIQMLAGLIIMLVTEVWYRQSKKTGGAT